MEETQIKLVIWDLDNTIWKGSLAEGDKPEPIEDFIDIIRSISLKGIVNSICSYNNYEEAKNLLENLGIWKYFVFPKINFLPKGPMVKQILEEMHLRDENVIFIDDDYKNHLSVKYHNPLIKTLNPETGIKYLKELKKILNEDKNLKRLCQYKLLEQKQKEQKKYVSNIEFLKQSNIVIKFIPLKEDLIDRTYELITRTNQLNFTKQRISKEDLHDIFLDKSLQSYLVNVKDNYGDYGLAGFYVLDKKRTLIHYTFSCRIMNMGVEQFVYQHLGFPNINLVGDTAVKLKKDITVDYIKILEKDIIYPQEELFSNIINPESKLNIFSNTTCDFELSLKYLLKTYHNVQISNAFYDKLRKGHISTEHIRSCLEMSEQDKNFCKKYFLNYDIDNAFKFYPFEKEYDYIIFSCFDDIEFKQYKNKNNNFCINYYDYDITNAINPNIKNKTKWFNDNFYDGEKISRERFYDNLIWISNHISQKTKIMLLTYPLINESIYFVDKDQINKINNTIHFITKKYPERFVLFDIAEMIKKHSDILESTPHLNAENTYKVFLKFIDVVMDKGPHNKPPLIGNNITKNRKICILGNNIFELKNAYYVLKLGNCYVDTIAYNDLEENPLKKFIFEFTDINKNMIIKNIMDINNEEYYVIIADKYNYSKFKSILSDKNFQPKSDFVFFDNNVQANIGDIYSKEIFYENTEKFI